ncbi:hypothetical protein R75471_04984 [Paraburkholderia domus]|uniref:DUF4347 domain-containing protein n=1 Tax=Paraburkholderia domus TaxID=2793075 RepID=UPI001B07C7EC|nr:DUF4347 domain-containing protein [Paraburkholderia domus]CAE6934554.1 hypothetical protein R75471_04984 [Paraburkholderia domus]
MKIIQQLLKRFSDGTDTQTAPADVRRSHAHTVVTPAPLLMALEPRVVYDASVAAIAAHPHAHGAEADTHAGAANATNATAHAAPKTIAEHDVSHVKPANDNGAQKATQKDTPKDTQKDGTQQPSQSGAAATADTTPHTVVFIDPSVPNYQTLIAGLPPGTPYVVLNATTDGFAQIAGYLQTHKGVDSIQLISHGADGEIQAGSTWLNAGDLSAYSGELAQIGAAMKPGGDFLIYGCDVAQKADGQLLVQQIAALTHLNVAASTDATGATSLGGNWTLEYQVGNVHTAVIESAAAQQQYDALLGVTVETYDAYAAGGYQNTSSTFTLDGITYVTDAAGAIENDIYTTTTDPFGAPDLSSGSGDGTLMLNFNGDQMSQVTIKMANGAHFSLSSFDLDAVSDGKIYIIPNGNTANEVLIFTGPGNGTGGTYTNTVNLSGNANFQNLTSFTIVDVGDDPGSNFVPSLDNLSYTILGPAVTPSSGSGAFTAGDNTASTPIAVDGGLTLSDPTSATAQSATISITNFKTGDELLFTPNSSTMGNISASYSSGVLTLTSSGGSASIAQWQTALDSITFTNTNITPNTTTRVISYSITDNGGAVGTATRNITVADTDQTPIVTLSGSNPTYLAGAAATPIDSGISVTDRDTSPTLASATISISSGFHTGDVLNFVNDSFVSGAYNSATGVLTLTANGSVSDAQWQTELDKIQFSTAANAPGGARTVSYLANDGTKDSAVVTHTVTVTAVPIVTTDSGSTAFAAGDNTAPTPVPVDSGLSLTDAGSTTFVSATVAITGNFHSTEDLLSFANNGVTMGNIASSYDATTGVMTLSSLGGSATLAQWQAALRSVTYTDMAVTPATATRTISFTVNDGTQTSATATRTVTVADTDQTPLLSTTGGSTPFVEADNAASTPVVIDSGVTVSDLDNTTLAAAHVSITGNFHAGEDVLAFSNTNSALFGNIVGTYDASLGVMTLTSSGSTATLAQWQATLRAVTYTDTAITPNAATRTISFSVNDGQKDSETGTKTVTVTATEQSPVLTASSGNFDYLPGAAARTIDSGITLTDIDSTTMVSLTVQFTSGFQSGDQLSLNFNSTTMGTNFTIAFDAVAGTFTITGTGSMTLANWQAVIDNVQFSAAAGAPLGTRSLSVVTSDGTKDSNTLDYNIDVVSSAPSLATTSTGSATFLAGDNTTSTPVVIDPNMSVADPLGNVVDTAVVSITGNLHSGEDRLGFVNDGATMGDITGTYNALTGVLVLSSSSGTATLAQWQGALRSVTYTDASVTPNSATRTVSFTLSAGSQISNALSRTITVSDTDQTPILGTSSSGSTSFVAGDNTISTPVSIDTGITVSDLDNGTLASATVQIGTGFHAGEDVLSFTNNGVTMGNITASYDAVHGTLTLSSLGASATLAQWQSALRSVAYTDTAVTPDTATRTISVSVSDGTKASTALTRTVTVADTDQTPLISTSSTGSTSFVAGDNTVSTPVVVDAGIALSDLDNTTLASATVQIGSGFHAGEDLLGFVNDGATMGNITGSYDTATGVMTLSSAGGTASIAQWQAALRSITYTDTAITPDTATRTIGFTVNDGTKSSVALTRTVTVADADQTPILGSTSTGSTPFVAADNAPSLAVAVDTGIVISDLDNTTLASATVQVGTGFHAGEDVLSFTNDGAAMGNITATYDAVHGTLTLSSTGASATLAQWQAALRSVTYTDTAITPDTATRTIGFTVNDGTKNSTALTRTVTVADTDQTPVVSTSSTGPASFVAGDNAVSTPVAVDAGIALSDRDNTTLVSATVRIGTGFHAGEDVLAFVNDGATMGNISASYDAATGMMTLTSAGGTASVAQWQAALRSVTYTDTALIPDTAPRTISFTVNDGTKDSVALTRNVTVADTDQSPIVASTSSGDTSFVSGDNVASTPVVVDGGITVSDLDNTTLASATVAITSGFQAGGDVLAFDSHNDTATFGNITGSYDAATGVMTLISSGHTATLAQWQAALRAITYTDTAVMPDGASRTISFTVNDNAKNSVAATRTIDLTATTQTPTLVGGSGDTPTFTASGANAVPVTIDSGIAITDPDPNAHIGSALVSISGNFQPGADVLTFNGNAATDTISASYDPNTGVLTLTSPGSSATLAQWQAALAAVTYAHTSAETSDSSRTISFSVNVDGKSSTVITRTVTVAAPQVTIQPIQPVAGPQPNPPTPITLPPHSPFVGGGSSVPSAPRSSPTTQAPDTIGTFPLNLTDSISNPLIVLDVFADAPDIGAIPAPHTATFSTGDFGELGASNGSGSGSGTHWHGSLSETSVALQPAIRSMDATHVTIDQPGQTLQVDVAANQSFTTSLPVMIGADGLQAGADTHVELRLADGRPLPAWLHYDPVRGTLSGKVPANQRSLNLAIVTRDAAGHQTRREVAIDFGGHQGHAERAPTHGAIHSPKPAAQAPHAAVPLAKPSLAEQFARAHATLHVARPTAAPAPTPAVQAAVNTEGGRA